MSFSAHVTGLTDTMIDPLNLWPETDNLSPAVVTCGLCDLPNELLRQIVSHIR